MAESQSKDSMKSNIGNGMNWKWLILPTLAALTFATWLMGTPNIKSSKEISTGMNWTQLAPLIVHDESNPVQVYFVWSTGKETFKRRHFAVLDSYLYHHPLAQLHIIASHLEQSMFEKYTERGFRVNIIPLDDSWLLSLAGDDRGGGCPGREWLQRLPEWRQGPYFYSHITDFIRFCVLYRYGGVYSDFDAYLLQRLDDKPWFHRGFIGKDSSGAGGKCDWCLADGDMYLAPGVMKAPRHAPVLKEALSVAFGNSSTYNAHIFNAVGPKAITLAMKKYPNSLKVLDTHVLYPYAYSEAHLLMNRTEDAWAIVERLQRKSVSLHLYGHQTRHMEEQTGSIMDAVYEKFAVFHPDGLRLHVTIDYLPVQRGSALIPHMRLLAPFNVDPHQMSGDLTVRLWSKYGSFCLLPSTEFHRELIIRGEVKNLNSMNAKLSQIVFKMNDDAERDQIEIEFISSDTLRQTHQIHAYNLPKLSTLIVKTFGRVDKVFSLVRSVQNYYPNLPILVADDGESVSKTAGKYKWFDYIPLPFDVGLSAGRNRLLERVTTPYFFTLDDDFVVDEHSVFDALIHALEVGQFDIAAGKNPVDEGKFGLDFCGKMQIDRKTLRLLPGYLGDIRAGCHPVEFVPNLFAARTELIRDNLLWDEQLKLGEHEDFFLRAKQIGVRVGTCPSVSFQHDQVPHWLKRTKYDKFRNRVYDFWKISLRKHGLERLVSFGTVMMDLIQPVPLRCLFATEIMPYSFSLEWFGCSDASAFKVVHLLGENMMQPVNGGEGELLRNNRITVRNIQPNTDYTMAVFASNGFTHENTGRKIIVRTLPKSSVDGEMLRNPGFENGHFHWRTMAGLPYHIVPEGHASRFAGRIHITTRGYGHHLPTTARLYQTVDVREYTRPFNRVQVVGWTRVERFYAVTHYWRLGVIIEFKDNSKPIKYHEEYHRDLMDWQVVSFTMCLRDGAAVARITVYGELVAHRGSVFFDDFSLKLLR